MKRKTSPLHLAPLINLSTIAGADHGQAKQSIAFAHITLTSADRTALAGAALA